MVLLALISIALLIFEVFANVSPEDLKIIHYVDITIALIFLSDFIYDIYRADDKAKFFKNRWWELIAAIPITNETTQALRALKLTRFMPLLEGLRFIRLTVRLKIIFEASLRLTKHTYMINVALILTNIILFGALAFNYFEEGVNPNVHTFFDSVWWAVVTIATIGYGDIYPVTTGGRIVAIILVFSGVGMLGVLIGVIDSYVLSRYRRR